LLTTGATQLHLCADIDEVARLRGAAPVAIDMPIGLLDSVGYRACDAEARKLLGRRASCVFAPPARYLLPAAGDYSAIRALVAQRRQHDPQTRGLSAQAAGIASKVAELDRFILAHPQSERWLFECHPELCFQELNGAPLAPKRSPEGRNQRRDLIARIFRDAPERLAAATWPRRQVDHTDLLDAYAVLTTAVRCASGRHRELGDGTRDAEAVLMRIAL
jgi:predicted RNase H-like nuclease